MCGLGDDELAERSGNGLLDPRKGPSAGAVVATVGVFPPAPPVARERDLARLGGAVAGLVIEGVS
jgi:hypothetical protein